MKANDSSSLVSLILTPSKVLACSSCG